MPHFGKGFMIRDLGNPGGSLRKLGPHQETLRSLIVIIAKEEKDRQRKHNGGRERTRDKEAPKDPDICLTAWRREPQVPFGRTPILR
jgi:hypothetical protein